MEQLDLLPDAPLTPTLQSVGLVIPVMTLWQPWRRGVGQIQLRCPKCSKTMMVERLSDDPARAMEMVIICPDCDDGDFHSQTYFAASGREVDWETGK